MSEAPARAEIFDDARLQAEPGRSATSGESGVDVGSSDARLARAARAAATPLDATEEVEEERRGAPRPAPRSGAGEASGLSSSVSGVLGRVEFREP